MLTDELRYKLLKLLQENPGMSQRDVARELGLSLGRVNFCLRALVERGFVKTASFKNSQNKSAYLYLLTPSGIQHKARVTSRFLKYKMTEYETLHAEIEQLRRDAREGREKRRP
jgi:EPS-associated MarR family transcriptional regulator